MRPDLQDTPLENPGKIWFLVLAGVAQRIECQPVNQSVAGLIQSGHMPGLRARSLVGVGGRVRGKHMDVSLSLSFSLPSPLLKNNKTLFKN